MSPCAAFVPGGIDVQLEAHGAALGHRQAVTHPVVAPIRGGSVLRPGAKSSIGGCRSGLFHTGLGPADGSIPHYRRSPKDASITAYSGIVRRIQWTRAACGRDAVRVRLDAGGRMHAIPEARNGSGGEKNEERTARKCIVFRRHVRSQMPLPLPPGGNQHTDPARSHPCCNTVPQRRTPSSSVRTGSLCQRSLTQSRPGWEAKLR